MGENKPCVKVVKFAPVTPERLSNLVEYVIFKCHLSSNNNCRFVMQLSLHWTACWVYYVALQSYNTYVNVFSIMIVLCKYFR